MKAHFENGVLVLCGPTGKRLEIPRTERFYLEPARVLARKMMGMELREAKDASGHEHAADSGQFTSGGGGSKAEKPKHGERAASLAAKHAELKAAHEAHKQERLKAYNEVKADAEVANEKASEHADGLQGHMDNIAWSSDDENDEPFADLESAIAEYDPESTVSERFAVLKDIESLAKDAVAAEQTQLTGDSLAAHRRKEEITADRSGKNEQLQKYLAMKKANPEDYAANHQAKARSLVAEMDKEDAEIGELDKRIGDDISPEQATENKNRLGEIITNARAARQQLKSYVQHRKEMKAIKEGSAVDAQESMLCRPDTDIEGWDLMESGFTGVDSHGHHWRDGKQYTVDEPEGKVGKAVKVTKEAYHAVHEAGSKAFHSLPNPVQKAVTTALSVAFAGWTASQKVAEQVAIENGATPEEAAAIRSTLAAADIVAFKPVSVAAAFDPTGTASIASWVVPPVTGCYLLKSAALHPLATFRAASTVVKDIIKWAKEKVAEHTQTLESEGSETLESLDASGHKHKGKGKDGGQFTSGGGMSDDKQDEAASAKGYYTPDLSAKNATTGVVDHARVGVPAMDVPPPPQIPRLPNLSKKQRKVESRFAEAYEKDPEKMARKYLKALRKRKVGEAPNIFATDDVKALNADWNPSAIGVGEKLDEDTKRAMAKYNTAVHQTANAITKKAFLLYLDEVMPHLPQDKQRVLVTNGGCAAGKGSTLARSKDPNGPHFGMLPAAEQVGAIWDAAGEQNATENAWIYDECKKRGIAVTCAYVWADPSQTWDADDRGVIRRAMRKGRMVDARLFADSYAEGAKNMSDFVNQNKDSDGLDFVFIDNRSKAAPKLLDAFPDETLQWNGEKIYADAVASLKAHAHDLDRALVKGGLNGEEIWGPPK